MKKIKILYITPRELSLEGISVFMLDCFRFIDKEKFEIDFVACGALDQIKKELEGKSNIFILKGRNKNPINYIAKLSKIIKSNHYDMVEVHGNSSILFLELLAATLAGCKVRIVHSHNTRTNHPFFHYILKPFFNMLYTHAFACGKEAGAWLFGKKSFLVIKNGRSSEKFKYNEIIRKKIRGIHDLENKIVVGHVGKFNNQKNQEFLIDIFYHLNKNNKKYKLLLIGEGNTKDLVKSKVHNLNLDDDTIFLENVNNVNEYMQAMDIFVMPSKFEGFPLVLVESQMSNLPAIVSDSITKDVKLTDLIEFESIDKLPEEWAEKIKKINISNRNKNIDDNILIIEKEGFCLEKNVKDIEVEYLKILENNKG